MTSPDALPSVSNFRQMGGLPAAGGTIRLDVLYRSGHLAEASDEDLEALAALGIETIIDFRTDVDMRGDGGPDRVPDGVDHMHLPVPDSSGMNSTIREVLMGRDQERIDAIFGGGKGKELAAEGVALMALEPEKQAVFAAFVRQVFATGSRPLLWHCSAGKDRAGWAATVLGMALGVPDDALMEHYLLSNVYRPVQHRMEYFQTLGVDTAPLEAFMLVHEDYLARGLEAIDSGWPSREAYLDEALGLNAAALDQLRSQLIV